MQYFGCGLLRFKVQVVLLLNLHLVKYSRELKIMNTVVDQRIILNMVLVVNLVKFTELSLLLLRLSQ